MGEIELSSMDERLLRFMMLNGAHHSVYSMGEKLRISPQTVAYKIRKFEEEGIISSYHYRVNPYKVGFRNMTWCALDISRHGYPEGLEERLLSHPNIFAVYSLAGQVDLLAKVFYSEQGELKELIEWLGVNFRDIISKVSIVSVMKVEKLYNTHGFDVVPGQLDDTSLAILDYKLAHTESSLKATADALDLHRNTVSRRWNQLWSKGVLLKKSFYVLPEVYKSLGFGVSACVFVDTVPGHHDSFVKNALNNDKVHEVFSLAFRHDLLLMLRTNDIDDCYGTMKSFYSSDRIEDTETLVILSHCEKNILPIH